MQQNGQYRCSVYLLVLVLALVTAVALNSRVSAKDCDGTKHDDTKCESAKAEVPSSHQGMHTDKGTTFWEIAKDGACNGDQDGNCCQLGISNMNIKEYDCDSSGTHTESGKTDKKDVCNC